MKELSKCHLCNSFEIGYGDTLQFDEWISEICSSKCLYCRLLVKGLEILCPAFLQQQTGIHLGQELMASIGEKTRVMITRVRNDRRRREIDIQFYYPISETPHTGLRLQNIAEAGNISPNPGHPAMWELLQRSLLQCLDEHPQCRSHQGPSWYPKRLLQIDQQSEEGEISIKLIDTQDQYLTGPYIALSHCWGLESFIRTTQTNLESHYRAINHSDLPRTFKDTVTVAIKLKISYIWIDSLCIVQGSKEDWARHSQHMGIIYEKALFVVAAVASAASSIPFLGNEAPSTRADYQSTVIEMELDDNMAGSMNPSRIMARNCGLDLFPFWISGPLEKRAWAWQERYRATRIINFTENEVKWGCRTSESCECRGELQPRSIVPDADTQELNHERWRSIVQEYSTRNLTYWTDRLPALAGVASQFSETIRSNYLAGIWENDLLRGLSWYRRDPHDTPSAKSRIYGTVDCGVPTWSWASNLGESYWLWDFYFDNMLSGGTALAPELRIESKVEVAEIRCKPSTENLFGEVQKGSFIELRGRLTKAVMKTDGYGRASVEREGFRPQYVVLDCRTVSCPADGYDEGDTQMLRAFYSDEDNISDTDSDQGQDTTSTGKSSLETKDPDFVYQGTVYCLLLFTAAWESTTQACVLVLGGDPNKTLQRLGIGCGNFENWSGPLYHIRRRWKQWEGWEDLELWEKWEGWFEDAPLCTVKII